MKTMDEHIAWFKDKYGDKKIGRMELSKENSGMYTTLLKSGRIDEFCLKPKMRNLDENIILFRKKYGNKKVGRKKLQKEMCGMYNQLRKTGKMDEFCLPSKMKTLDEHIAWFKDKYGDKKIGRTGLNKINPAMYQMITKHKRTDEFCLPQHYKKPTISKYIPKTIILPNRRTKSKDKNLNPHGKGFGNFQITDEKRIVRPKIVTPIEDGDNCLILESQELQALDEIIKQNKKPSKITIPNNNEANEILENLLKRGYKIINNKGGIAQLEKENEIPITIVNSDVINWLADSNEKYNFIWLDYCGAFSYYMRDLDVLFAKNLDKIKLVLTYSLFDPMKSDENYYLTRVINYVLKKVNGKSGIELFEDITYRYKKNMYNVGFNIQEVKNDN